MRKNDIEAMKTFLVDSQTTQGLAISEMFEEAHKKAVDKVNEVIVVAQTRVDLLKKHCTEMISLEQAIIQKCEEELADLLSGALPNAKP